jgi:serine/threonine protein kinase
MQFTVSRPTLPEDLDPKEQGATDRTDGVRPRCEDTLMQGEGEFHGPGQVILERYELMRVLGSGGWGRVYLATDRLLHRMVAIKQLLPRLAADPAAVSRFKREASAIASIRDPNVLTIYDISECGAQHYMVMEYADAGTLAQRMQLEGILPAYEAMSVAIDICKGLRAIHLNGIIHRDVKPANVMFFSRPDTIPAAKLGDLGIALQRDEGKRLTPSDGVLGTLIYLSPEQAASQSLSPASDLYSLGTVIYETLGGELQEPVFLNPLFSGTSGETLQQLGAIPDPARPLLVKALRRKPEDRFQNADEMLQALERARGRLSISLSTQTFAQIVPVLPVAPVVSPPPPAAKPRWLMPLLGVVVVILALLVGAGIAAAVRLSTGSADPTIPAMVAVPTQTPTPIPTPTPTVSPLPSATPTESRPTSTFTPEPTPLPSDTPTLSPVEVVPRPTRVEGAAVLTLMFRDSSNKPDGVYMISDSTSAPVIYEEGSYLWGEISTRVGNAVFQVNRQALDRTNPKQHLPSYLQLAVEYSPALVAAVQEVDNVPPGFNSSTGEFWGGNFWCGSAVQPKDSPYWMAIKLLEDGQIIAGQRYVIGVIESPNCPNNPKDKTPSAPPTRRP